MFQDHQDRDEEDITDIGPGQCMPGSAIASAERRKSGWPDNERIRSTIEHRTGHNIRATDNPERVSLHGWKFWHRRYDCQRIWHTTTNNYCGHAGTAGRLLRMRALLSVPQWDHYTRRERADWPQNRFWSCRSAVIIYIRVSSSISMKFRYVVWGMILNNFFLYLHAPPFGFSFRDIHRNILVFIRNQVHLCWSFLFTHMP